jgi:hypothetical protein
VKEDVAACVAGGRDLLTCDRRRGRQDELDGVLHGLRGVIEEDVHRARADVDREDAIVGHETDASEEMERLLACVVTTD